MTKYKRGDLAYGNIEWSASLAICLVSDFGSSFKQIPNVIVFNSDSHGNALYKIYHANFLQDIL